MKKLEEKELQSLKTVEEKISTAQMQIGAIEADKFRLIAFLNQAITEKQALVAQLEMKYGKVRVDINTGEIKEDEPSKED